MVAIDFIYFDLGNVVLNFSHQRACEQVGKLVNMTAPQIRQVAFETQLVTDYEIGNISDDQFHAGFCTISGVHVNREEFLVAFSDIFWLNQTVVPLIVELRQMQFPIGILSNTCNAHWQFAVNEFPLLRDHFDIQVLSFQCRRAKPDRGIYEAAARCANLDPTRIFFVDDRPDNVAGAIQTGFDAVLFESATQLRHELFQRGLKV